MKSFRDYISEEVVPTALVKDGSIDIDKEEVRASINMALAKVTSDSSITPYIALNRISKALSMFHIILPKRVYLEGAKGVEVHELRQFGDKMGMNDQGEFINEVPGKYFLFIQYGMNTPMNSGGQYAYPTMAGTFRVTAKVVDPIELNRLLDVAEITVSEECNAETQQLKAKMLALKEPMKDLATDGSPSTDADVATSERKSNKKLSAGSLDEEQLDELDIETLKSYKKGAKADRKLAKNILKKASTGHYLLGRRDDDKLDRTIANRKVGIKKAKEKIATAKSTMEEDNDIEIDKKSMYKDLDNWNDTHKQAKQFRDKQDDVTRSRRIGTDKDGESMWSVEEEYEKVEAGVKKRKGETHTLHKRNPGHKTEYHTITSERDGRKSVKTGSPKYIKKHWDKLEEKFGVYRKGGSIGEKPSNEPNKTFDSAEEAKAHAKSMNKILSPGEKKYYGIKYHVKPIKEETLDEKHLTSAETRKKEEIVKSMKKGLADFKERYGKRAKEVMYATATKRAKQVAEKLEFDPSTEIPKNS